MFVMNEDLLFFVGDLVNHHWLLLLASIDVMPGLGSFKDPRGRLEGSIASQGVRLGLPLFPGKMRMLDANQPRHCVQEPGKASKILLAGFVWDRGFSRLHSARARPHLLARPHGTRAPDPRVM